MSCTTKAPANISIDFALNVKCYLNQFTAFTSLFYHFKLSSAVAFIISNACSNLGCLQPLKLVAHRATPLVDSLGRVCMRGNERQCKLLDHDHTNIQQHCN